MSPLRAAMLSLTCLLVFAGCDTKTDDGAAKKAEPAKTDAKADEPAKADPAKTDEAPKKEEPAEPKPESYGGEFCAAIIPCFQKFEFTGNFVAEVDVDIEPDGSVSAVSFTGEAPKPVQTCISEDIQKIKLAEYNGKPGRTHCSKSGQLMGGGQMVMSDTKYEVREAG